MERNQRPTGYVPNGTTPGIPDNIRQLLTNYRPSNRNDDTVKILEETFRYLPADGRTNLIEDIMQCENDDNLRQLAQRILNGMLIPIKVAGHRSLLLTEYPDEKEQRLRKQCAQRDGDRCVVTGYFDCEKSKTLPRGVETEYLETAHIVPCSLHPFKDNFIERRRLAIIWSNIYRYFPSLRTGLDHECQNRDTLENVMMLNQRLYREFEMFSWTLQASDTPNEYTVKTFSCLSTIARMGLPDNGKVVLRAHDNRRPLPDSGLLAVHAAIANILHATGYWRKVEEMLAIYDRNTGLSPAGRTDVARLLSVSDLPTLACL